MTPVEIREYRSIELALPAAVAHEVAAIAGSALDVSPALVPGRWHITANSHVGTVSVGDLSLLIRPKVPAANLFHMLEAGGTPVPVRPETFDYERSGDLLPAFATFFAAGLERAVARGIPRRYEEIEDRLVALRGRVNVKEQLKLGSLPLPVACRYDEHTADIQVNRISKAAVNRLLLLPGVSVATRLALARLSAQFDEVSTIRPSDIGVQTTFSRLDEHFEPVDRLSRLVLSGSSITNRAGGVPASTFLVNMNQVFETFLEASLARALRGRLAVIGQLQLRLDDERNVTIQPDLTFLRGRGPVYVGDAKYKLTTSGFGINADYYQLLAYTTGLDLPEGVLVYCQDADAPVPPQLVTVRHSGKRLHSRALTLAGGPADLDAEIDQLADWIESRLVAVDAVFVGPLGSVGRRLVSSEDGVR